ncbi:hypothetical protein [Streptomyces sp. NPDC048659]|uniref:hypothetical protein n=1 Tax=Streptomyces sp. NPDC048659 TaxID=3155489 RepID=UPI00343ABCBD
MGWTVLYIAFGVVALWLLGEVLLQYKARLRWRLLAFGGFLTVVVGVLLPSVLVIVAGAIAFAVGQTYVTLSFRRGFSTGWAIGGNPGASRRRRGTGRAAKEGPTLEVSDLSYEAAEPEGAAARAEDPFAGDAFAGVAAGTAAAGAVYEPEPMPEDTGQYGVYGTSYEQPRAEHQPYAAADTYAGGGYEQQPGYDYAGGEQQQYAAYSDPYIGSYPETAQQYDGYQQPYADPYAPSYTYDTPPGGVWVPQQQNRADHDGAQPQQPQPYQDQQGHHGYGEDQQYRY